MISYLIRRAGTPLALPPGLPARLAPRRHLVRNAGLTAVTK